MTDEELMKMRSSNPEEYKEFLMSIRVRTPEEIKECDDILIRAWRDVQPQNIVLHETFHEEPKRNDIEFTKSELYALAITIGSLAFGITLAVYAIHNSFI